MRFDRVTSDGDWKFALDLHPRVTLLAGLGDERSTAMAELLEEVIRGRARDVDAVVELDGQRLAFDEWRQRANGEIGSVELVLRAGDLPGASHEAAAAGAARAAQRAVEKAERALAEARQAAIEMQRPIEADGAAMRQALDQATDALAEAEVERGRLRDQIAEAKAAAAGATEAAEEALRAAEQAATESDRAARQWAKRRSELVEGLRHVDEEMAKAAARHRELETERASLSAGNSEAGTVDTEALEALEAVSQALAAIPADSEATREASARELLGRWDDLAAGAGSPADFTKAPAWLVSSARQTLEEARIAAIKAEEAAKPLSISPADAGDLERAQREVVEAEERASRTLSGPRAQHRLVAANAVLQGVLDRIGVSSYSAYLLRAVNIGERTDRVEELDRARRALADAEAVWEELRAGDREVPESQRQEELGWRADAAALLGVSDEPAEDLASLAEGLLRLADQRGRARAALAETLGRLGIALGPGDDPERAASDWLASRPAAPDAGPAAPPADIDEQLAAIAEVRSELEAQRSALQTQLDDLRLSEGPAPNEPSNAATQLAERVARATARVDELEARAVQTDQRVEDTRMAKQIAEAGLTAVDGANAGAVSELTARLQAEVRVKQSEVDAARAAARAAAERAATAPPDENDPRAAASDADREIYVLARVAAVRSVGSLGAVPFVMVDPFDGLDPEHRSKLHASLKRMSEVVQLIYFTDSPDALAWAEQLGEDWAAVRDPDSLVRPEPADEPDGVDGRTVAGAKLRRRPYGFGHRRRRA